VRGLLALRADRRSPRGTGGGSRTGAGFPGRRGPQPSPAAGPDPGGGLDHDQGGPERAKAEIKVEQIRELVAESFGRPFEADARFFVIDDATR